MTRADSVYVPTNQGKSSVRILVAVVKKVNQEKHNNEIFLLDCQLSGLISKTSFSIDLSFLNTNYNSPRIVFRLSCKYGVYGLMS